MNTRKKEREREKGSNRGKKRERERERRSMYIAPARCVISEMANENGEKEIIIAKRYRVPRVPKG